MDLSLGETAHRTAATIQTKRRSTERRARALTRAPDGLQFSRVCLLRKSLGMGMGNINLETDRGRVPVLWNRSKSIFLFRVTMTTTINGALPLAPRLPLEMPSTLPPRWQAHPVQSARRGRRHALAPLHRTP